jgi:glycerol-3-phosphate dehydrogenase (NAD(P)+)
MNSRFAVIGGGSWATAIIKMLCNNCDEIGWWMRDEDQVSHITEFGHNPKYLASAEFDEKRVKASTNLQEIIDWADTLIIATPSAFIHDTFIGKKIQGKNIVSAVKGIIPQTNEIPADYFQNNFELDLSDFAIICGPCHAEEVAMERLSYLTIASKRKTLAQSVSSALTCRYINCTNSEDVVGAEIAAVLKNVYALAGGISHGLGYGDNFIAVLISNAIQEIERFIDVVYPLERDVKVSAYLGDLLVTAYSPHSRNRSFGNMIGKGYSVKAIQQEMNMVAEGYYATACIHELNDLHKVNLPIADAVYSILYNRKSARSIFAKLSQEIS